ncbi:hypothetical protein [Halobacillus sp. KGW1]|uniref:hypothetical protein n=1 Tax=Halobacillus sp. KGW1 TaxID=1793726 RepID=UPI00128FD1A2|nr:hypothetical protein [Halobacillus sp. KGW1]
MKRWMLVMLFAIVAGMLAACGSGEPVEEKEYDAFKEEIAKEDFTGFAYILSDYEAEDNGYLPVLEEVFEEEGQTLVYFNDQQASDDVHEVFNEDSKKKDLFLPIDTIAYIENGQPAAELEVTEELIQEKDQETLRTFVADHS